MDFSINSKKIELINKHGEKVNEYYFKNINYFKDELFINNQNYCDNLDFDYYNSSCDTLSANSIDNCKIDINICTNFFNNYNNDNNNFKISSKLF